MVLKISHTLCPSCSVGCGINIVSDDDIVLGTYSYKRHPINEGKNCLNGRNSVVDFDKRIAEPLVLKGKEQEKAELEDVINQLVSEIKNVSPEKIGIICSGNNSNEEMEAIKKFSENMNYPVGFYTDNFPKYDGKVAEYDDVDKASNVLVLGDIFNDNPLVARRIVHAKENGAKLISAGTKKDSITAINSDDFYFTESIAEFLSNFKLTEELDENSVIILSEIESFDNFDIIKNLAEENNIKILPLFSECNTKGGFSFFDPYSKEDIEKLIDSSDLLLVFGNTDLNCSNSNIISFAPVENDLTLISKIVLPIKSWIENEGTFTNAMNLVQSFTPVVEANDAILSEIEIIEKLEEKLME